ncbi:MAG: glycosyltransferase [Smithella sp.]
MSLQKRNLCKTRALVMCMANPSRNPRPRRVIELLRSQGCEVDLLSYKSDGDLDVRSEYEIKSSYSSAVLFRALRLAAKLLRNLVPFPEFKNKINEWLLDLQNWDHLSENDYDLLSVENIELLPLALRIKRGHTKVLCDLREYYPREFESSPLFRLLESGFKYSLCTNYLNKCDALISVSPGLVAEYSRQFQLDVTLVRSTPVYRDVAVTKPTGNVIRMVHHGVASRERNLANMINLFDYLDERFQLDFYLTGDSRYKAELMELAAPYKKIRILDPVPFNQIIPMLNQYDIGLYLLEPAGFNTRYSLPNKLFEYIQARLMVAVGPSPDMAYLVDAHQCGMVSSTFEPKGMANLLNQLTLDQIMQFKLNSDLAARDLCFETESKKLISIMKGFEKPA